jgi:hypothetical protein
VTGLRVDVFQIGPAVVGDLTRRAIVTMRRSRGTGWFKDDRRTTLVLLCQQECSGVAPVDEANVGDFDDGGGFGGSVDGEGTARRERAVAVGQRNSKPWARAVMG